MNKSVENNLLLQWALLNEIMDFGINRLMESNLSRFTSLVNGISYGLTQSDPIKSRPLYKISEDSYSVIVCLKFRLCIHFSRSHFMPNVFTYMFIILDL